MKFRRATAASILLAITSITNHAVGPSGAPDVHFGTGGLVITATAPGSNPDLQSGLDVDRDGKIVVGGVSYMGEDAGGLQWRVSRYTKQGLLDPTFGSGGTVLTNMSSVGEFDELLKSLAIQDDGKIVAAGWIMTDAETQNSALIRYNADGSIDTSFGDNGIVITNVASEPDHDFINQVLIDTEHRIVVSGGCRRIFVGRYLPDGQLDPSFNPSGDRPGLALTEIAPSGETNSEILGMAIDREGRIVGGGYSTFLDGSGFAVRSAVVRFLSDGTLDPSFNPTGARPGAIIASTEPGGKWNVIFRVAVDRQGRILTAGDAFVGVGAGLYDVALARFSANGLLDTSFGNGGVVLTNLRSGDSDDDAQGLAIEPNGMILVGGSAAPTAFTFDSDFVVARFRPNGSLDPSFGQAGIAITPTAPGAADDEIYAMTLVGGAHLVASGECDQATTGRDVCVMKYDLEGGAKED